MSSTGNSSAHSAEALASLQRRGLIAVGDDGKATLTEAGRRWPKS